MENREKLSDYEKGIFDFLYCLEGSLLFKSLKWYQKQIDDYGNHINENGKFQKDDLELVKKYRLFEKHLVQMYNGYSSVNNNQQIFPLTKIEKQNGNI